MATVTTKQLARALDVTERRIFQYLEAGMPKLAPGKYDFAACLLWVIKYYRKLLEKREVPLQDEGLREGKARVVKLTGDLKELELLRLRGQLIDLESVKTVWEKSVVRVRQKLLSLVSKAAPHAVNLKSVPKARAFLEQTVISGLEALSHVGHEVRKAALASGWASPAEGEPEQEVGDE